MSLLLHSFDWLGEKTENVNRISDLRDWQSGGSYVEVADGLKIFYRKGGKCGDSSVAETVILVHGFPTSSYDYARSHEILEKDFCVVMFDHVGFGFSDKPTDPQYIYSIFTAAENALELWRQLKIRSAHIVAHDMGDSVITEILSRRQRNMLPSQIGNDFFKVGLLRTENFPTLQRF